MSPREPSSESTPLEPELPPRPLALHAARASGALWLLVMALAILGVAEILRSLLTTSVLARLFEADGGHDVMQLADSLQSYDRVFGCLAMLASVLAGVALSMFARASGGRTRIVAFTGAAGFAGSGALFALPFLFHLIGRDEWSILGRAWSVALCLSLAIGYVGSLCSASRVSGARGSPLPAALVALTGLWITWDCAWPIYRLLTHTRIAMSHETPWLYCAVTTGIWTLGIALLTVTVGLAAARLRSQPSGDDMPASAGGLSPAGWREAAGGLDLYATALIWRLALTILAYLLLYAALSTRSVGLAKLGTWILPLASVVTGLVMIVGVYRYCRQPANSPGRSAAYGAFVLMLSSIALEGYGLLLTLRLVTLDASEWEVARSVQATAESVERLSMWAMIAGFSAVLALLLSFRQVVLFLGERRLGNRVVGVALSIEAAAVVAIGFRCFVQQESQVRKLGLGVGEIAVLALVVLALALAAVVAHIALTKAVARGIREAAAGAPSELPEARVLRK